MSDRGRSRSRSRSRSGSSGPGPRPGPLQGGGDDAAGPPTSPYAESESFDDDDDEVVDANSDDAATPSALETFECDFVPAGEEPIDLTTLPTSTNQEDQDEPGEPVEPVDAQDADTTVKEAAAPTMVPPGFSFGDGFDEFARGHPSSLCCPNCCALLVMIFQLQYYFLQQINLLICQLQQQANA